MWVKISTIEQLEKLHEGALVSIYPVQGAPKDEYDGSDPDQAISRLVAENDVKAKMIHMAPLQRKEEARTVTSGSMGSMILDAGHKSYVDIIEQGVWWVQEGL